MPFDFGTGSDGVRLALDDGGRHSEPSNELLAALAAAALYPQLAYVEPVNFDKPKPMPKGIRRQPARLQVRDPDGASSVPQSCQVHPSSVAADLEWRTPYACFHDRVKTAKLYLRDATPVPPLAPFLMAGAKLVYDSATGSLVLDGWLKLKCDPPSSAFLIDVTRRRLEERVTRLVLDAAANKRWDSKDDPSKILKALDALLEQRVGPPAIKY